MIGVIYAAAGSADEILREVASEFSPQIELPGPCEVVLDLSGLTRLFGEAHELGESIVHTADGRGLRVRVALAGTRTVARLMAHAARGPVTVVEIGDEAAAIAPLPVELLTVVAPSHPRTLAPSHLRTLAPPSPSDPDISTFRRWGVRTLGEVAALPADAVAARLGQQGVRWQRLARGQDARPLQPDVLEERFEQALDLEWPIEGLEPLSFVLGRLMEPLSAHLERRGRAAAVIHVRLHLVTKTVHARRLELPAPLRDARTLRTLVLLDLESHPTDAAIDRVEVQVEPTPGRDLQYSLLTRPLPSPERLSTLMARVTALMGEGRCGSPALVDSWEPGVFTMRPFAPTDLAPSHSAPSHSAPSLALRRFRRPVPARVRVEEGKPVRVATDRVAVRASDLTTPAELCGEGHGGVVTQCAGPWRTAGHWWSDTPWDRDEWDVTLGDGTAYRVFRDRRSDGWFVEGQVD